MKRKLIYLSATFLVMAAVMLGLVSVLHVNRDDTESRYIKRDRDEIRASYTSLYFDTTGDGSVIALENGKGYITFDVMNYIEGNVSERNIIYDVEVLTTFYDSSANVIADPSTADELYALDVWGVPQMIEKDTYKYSYSIVSNSGETITYDSETAYLFNAAKGAQSHTVTVQVERTGTVAMTAAEQVSIIIQLKRPYKQIYIINTVISDQLIVFSSVNTTMFNIPVINIQTQTADIFKYATDDNSEQVQRTINEFDFTSYAFKVVYEWDNLIVNENDLKFVHNNQVDVLTGEASYIDITKPYIVEINQDTDTGTFTIYVPQGSIFTFSTEITDSSYYMKATTYIFDGSVWEEYAEETYGGYSDDSTPGLAIIVNVE